MIPAVCATPLDFPSHPIRRLARTTLPERSDTATPLEMVELADALCVEAIRRGGLDNVIALVVSIENEHPPFIQNLFSGGS